MSKRTKRLTRNEKILIVSICQNPNRQLDTRYGDAFANLERNGFAIIDSDNIPSLTEKGLVIAPELVEKAAEL